MPVFIFMLSLLFSFNAFSQTSSYENCYGAATCQSCGNNCYYTYSGATLNVYGPTEKNTDGSYKENAQISPLTSLPSGVTNVQISGNVTAIEENAFKNFKKLQTITLPESLQSIGSNAFWGTGITEIYIPKNVTSFGGDVFRASALKTVEFAEDSKMTTTGGRSFLIAGNLEKVILPNGLKTISGDTFYGDGKLTSLNIPDTVTSIYASAFESVQLTELTTNAENLIRFLHPNKTTCAYYCGGNFKNNTDIKINCTGTKSCEDSLQNWLTHNYGEDKTTWPSWSNRITFNNRTKVKNADGSYSIYELGKLVGFEGKRIYTVDEATQSFGTTGKNTFSIRYR